jgi:tRNA G18 (ribose-2'-O)-methylase SpoU
MAPSRSTTIASSRSASRDDVAVERIDCANDPRAEAFRIVREADLLRERGLFVAEGRLVVRRMLEDDRFAVESVLVNDAALRDIADALARLDAAVPVFVCPTEAFRALVGFDLHRGCVALVRRPAAAPVDALIAAARTLVVLDAVANPDNVGGIFRNAAAFGADGVVLSPAAGDPLYRKAIRTSMGAALQVPFARCAESDWPDAIARARASGFTIVALTPREPSETLDAFAERWRPSKLALVVGSEGSGLSPDAESAADCRVRIPITNRVDSLNVAVAVGIVLARLTGR